MSGCPPQLGARNKDSGRTDCSRLRYAQHEANFLRDTVTPVSHDVIGYNNVQWRSIASNLITYLVLRHRVGYPRSPLLNSSPGLE
jgi:citrate lyase alpha subunit